MCRSSDKTALWIVQYSDDAPVCAVLRRTLTGVSGRFVIFLDEATAESQGFQLVPKYYESTTHTCEGSSDKTALWIVQYSDDAPVCAVLRTRLRSG